MDYTLGSIGDLISGANTFENTLKKKVVQKKFKPLAKKEVNGNESAGTDATPPKLKQKKKPEDNGLTETTKVAGKKRKQNKSELSKPVETTGITNPKRRKLKKASQLHDDAKVIQNGANEENVDESEDETLSSDNDEAEVNTAKNHLHNAEKRMKAKVSKAKHEAARSDDQMPLYNERTIFIGNVSVDTKKSKLIKYFSKYGKIEAQRFRSAPLADSRTPKKVAMIKKEFHANRSSMNAYIRFSDREEALKATIENGNELNGKHIRVAMCDAENSIDERKAVFVGNLSFDAEEEELWKIFEPCGKIESVRIIRDRRTNVGKGFGYVNFLTADAMELALQMKDIKINDRVLRISACNQSGAKKLKKKQKMKIKRQSGDNHKTAASKSPSEPDRKFQGTKLTELKKKKKFNKGDHQKKQMVKKLAPRITA